MSDNAIIRMHSDIVNTVAYEASIGSGSWSDILKSDDIQSRRRFFIACGIQAMQQLGGEQSAKQKNGRPRCVVYR